MKVENKNYEEELQKLREQRNFHQKEYDRLAKEMDDLESDSKVPLEDYIGKFVKIDRTGKFGNIYWFKVQKPHEKRPRGIYFTGIGFREATSPNTYMNIDTSLHVMWDEINNLEIVEEKDYVEALERVKADIFDVLEFKKPYKEPPMWKEGFKNER